MKVSNKIKDTMMLKQPESPSNGVRIVVLNGTKMLFPKLLTILFIALKLVGVIKWSWLWVLSPLWITVTLGVPLLPFAVSRVFKNECFNVGQ